ncbi:MAG TPA: DUF3536 domain-containing protein [Candidatus Binataceae bacterium]|nr:DUF3536 domain-containing protein [Candidatus Binataceae bacterium]
MTSVILHGHFYQPPRENPWTGAIEHQESARPFHDWNEKIYAECYRPNAHARVLDDQGRIEHIVNNYTNLSFNFGPTLIGWLENFHPATCAGIVEADRHSVERNDGHGNAIAQAYGHAILPLCNERDRRTQVQWGIADFRYRFGREPEALWLPETACNDAVMSALIDVGMKFVILSPHQAERFRQPGSEQWTSGTDGNVDPRRVYRYLHRDNSGRSIAVFFYDDGLARAIAFEHILVSSDALIDRLEKAAAGAALVNVATDGESYGHHFHFGDRCIAYALEFAARQRGMSITNYGAFLARNPPEYEVEIKRGPHGEGTAWSCAHGVGRWARDCGCKTGGDAEWNQAWRAPLRAAFDMLRDECAARFEDAGSQFFRDPWSARDNYIDVLLTRGERRSGFLARFARRRLGDSDALRTMKLLEMQRNALLMYTSCGWFFSEISGIETVQVMNYAARAMDLMRELGMAPPEDRFVEILAEARSNVAGRGTGADVYRTMVAPSRVKPIRIAANLAISSLGRHAGHHGTIGDFRYRHDGFRAERHGRLELAITRLMLTNNVDGERFDFAAAVLYLGGADFHCTLRRFDDSSQFENNAHQLWHRLRSSSLPGVIRAIQERFGPDEYGLEDVLLDDRLRICESIFADVLAELTDEFTGLYQTHHRVLDLLQKFGFETPPEFRTLTEFTFGKRLEREILAQHRSGDPASYRVAVGIAAEIARRGYKVDSQRASEIFSAMITDAVETVLARPSASALRSPGELLSLARELGLSPDLQKAQELMYSAFMRAKPNVGRLARVAIALGISENALKRMRTPRPRPAHPARTIGQRRS